VVRALAEDLGQRRPGFTLPTDSHEGPGFGRGSGLPGYGRCCRLVAPPAEPTQDDSTDVRSGAASPQHRS
jgi:hypothetical protein